MAPGPRPVPQRRRSRSPRGPRLPGHPSGGGHPIGELGEVSRGPLRAHSGRLVPLVEIKAARARVFGLWIRRCGRPDHAAVAGLPFNAQWPHPGAGTLDHQRAVGLDHHGDRLTIFDVESTLPKGAAIGGPHLHPAQARADPIGDGPVPAGRHHGAVHRDVDGGGELEDDAGGGVGAAGPGPEQGGVGPSHGDLRGGRPIVARAGGVCQSGHPLRAQHPWWRARVCGWP